jgi:Ca2+-binding EF-hand superfamily protein
MIALKIVEQYRKQFDYLDNKPVDDLLSPEELGVGFRDFDWPKVDPSIADPTEYGKVLVQKYDQGGKGSINFVEFCKLGEDLWNSADMLQEQNCKEAFNKSKEVFDKLFEWLDRDHDGGVNPEDMIFGISRMMIRDADIEEVGKVFAKYDPNKTGKINKENFNLAVINGLLDKSFRDTTFKETFIK